ncbi:response regulator transcription factor [Halobacillus litoralis]|uniref:response regulator transcription factor n=1 Tax=Halobacillus litoralis TaxID=45668 RepID=UPI001CFE78A0|nr:response regulator transcription factor [Halobacillus litoralis]
MESLYKVVVVDDEMLIRQGIINYIDWEREGFQIAGEASNGNEALQLVEELNPHVLITDVVMPGMNGIELVRIVKEKYPAIEVIVLSSFENFDYVRSSFQIGIADYILKPKLNGEELIKTLQRVVPDSKSPPEIEQQELSIEQVLQKQLSGSYLTPEETEKLETLSEGVYTLLGICRKLEEEEDGHLRIEKRLEEHRDLKMVKWIDNNESDFSTALIIQDTLHSSTLYEKSVSTAREYHGGGGGQWILSDSFSSLSELTNVYEKQLLKMKEYAFYLPDLPVLMKGNLPDLSRNERPFDLSRFIDRFKQKKFDIAVEELRRHLDSLTKDYTLDVFEFKSWMENVIFNSIVLLGNMKYRVDELETLKYEYFATINEAANVDDAAAPFHDFLKKVQGIVQLEEGQGEHPENVRRLLEHIEDHYAEPLSLTTLANCFHFNPSYLSSYFSTHLKVGFVDYLNKVRIEKAKQILETTKKNIGEVSEMVGYSDPSYFCKVFKRVAGSSPGKYRKKALAAN